MRQHDGHHRLTAHRPHSRVRDVRRRDDVLASEHVASGARASDVVAHPAVTGMRRDVRAPGLILTQDLGRGSRWRGECVVTLLPTPTVTNSLAIDTSGDVGALVNGSISPYRHHLEPRRVRSGGTLPMTRDRDSRDGENNPGDSRRAGT